MQEGISTLSGNFVNDAAVQYGVPFVPKLLFFLVILMKNASFAKQRSIFTKHQSTFTKHRSTLLNIDRYLLNIDRPLLEKVIH